MDGQGEEMSAPDAGGVVKAALDIGWVELGDKHYCYDCHDNNVPLPDIPRHIFKVKDYLMMFVGDGEVSISEDDLSYVVSTYLKPGKDLKDEYIRMIGVITSDRPSSYEVMPVEGRPDRNLMVYIAKDTPETGKGDDMDVCVGCRWLGSEECDNRKSSDGCWVRKMKLFYRQKFG